MRGRTQPLTTAQGVGAVAGALLYRERSTVKACNLAADPRVVVHLESGEDVVIVTGTAEDLGRPAQVPSVVAALAAKYTRPEDQRYLPAADPDFDVGRTAFSRRSTSSSASDASRWASSIRQLSRHRASR